MFVKSARWRRNSRFQARCLCKGTPAEKILWQELRANKLRVHFRGQQVIAGLLVDFYCHKAGLVVEVDGDIHDLQQEGDARRELGFSAGCRVWWCSNRAMS